VLRCLTAPLRRLPLVGRRTGRCRRPEVTRPHARDDAVRT
jgi:hypothetical protein